MKKLLLLAMVLGLLVSASYSFGEVKTDNSPFDTLDKIVRKCGSAEWGCYEVDGILHKFIIKGKFVYRFEVVKHPREKFKYVSMEKAKFDGIHGVEYYIPDLRVIRWSDGHYTGTIKDRQTELCSKEEAVAIAEIIIKESGIMEVGTK